MSSAGASAAARPGNSADQPVATVVIVNYNGEHLLRDCLDAVRIQDMPPDSFRTVVVDNASSDGSRELLRNEYPWVHLISSYRNRGFAGGNNLALETASTPYVALLNNDAVPEPDWLRLLLAPLIEDEAGAVTAVASKILFRPRYLELRLKTDPFLPGGGDSRELGVRIHAVHVDDLDVTSAVVWDNAGYGQEQWPGQGAFRWSRPDASVLVPIPEGSRRRTVSLLLAANQTKDVELAVGTRNVIATLQSGRSPVTVVLPAADAPVVSIINNAGGRVLKNGMGGDRGFGAIDDGAFDTAEEVFAFCGNGVAMRSEAGHRLGWFDDSFFMYYEDVDLSWRVRSSGGLIRYEPGAVLRHIHSASSVAGSARWTFYVERNRLFSVTKNMRGSRALRIVAGFAVSTIRSSLREEAHALRVRRRVPRDSGSRIRLRALGSYLRALPRLLAARRSIGSAAVVSRRSLENWLEDVPS
ncbi:hypothetical protein BH09ACT5_BH09ACT5_14150 [soil metagenome]